MCESGPNATPWEQVAEDYTAHAQRALDRLPSFVHPDVPAPSLRVTPEQLGAGDARGAQCVVHVG